MEVTVFLTSFCQDTGIECFRELSPEVMLSMRVDSKADEHSTQLSIQAMDNSRRRVSGQDSQPGAGYRSYS